MMGHFKRGLLAAAALLFAVTAHAAGTVPGFSLTPQFDNFGKVMPGCKLFVIQAGTTATPQLAYQDTALTVPLTNPLTCDASGRLPQWFVADGLIKVRVTDKNLTQIFVGDNLLVVGASSGGGGGGGGAVDPTTIAATGDIKDVYGTGPITGWVRMNARTIGSASSGASERANSDAQALFVYLWNSDATLVVPGGRGANAGADFAANKVITLPDQRGRARVGIDDMGGADSGRLGGGLLATCRLSLGCGGGESSHSLIAGEIPNIASSGSNALNLGVSVPSTANGNVVNNANNAGASGAANSPVISSGWGTFSGWTQGINVTSNGTGGSAPTHNNMQPSLLTTSYIKL